MFSKSVFSLFFYWPLTPNHYTGLRRILHKHASTIEFINYIRLNIYVIRRQPAFVNRCSRGHLRCLFMSYIIWLKSISFFKQILSPDFVNVEKKELLYSFFNFNFNFFFKAGGIFFFLIAVHVWTWTWPYNICTLYYNPDRYICVPRKRTYALFCQRRTVTKDIIRPRRKRVMKRVVGGANGWNKIRKSGGNALRNDRCRPCGRNRIGKKTIRRLLFRSCPSATIFSRWHYYFLFRLPKPRSPYPAVFSTLLVYIFLPLLGRPLNTPLKCSRKLNSDRCVCVYLCMFLCPPTV